MTTDHDHFFDILSQTASKYCADPDYTPSLETYVQQKLQVQNDILFAHIRDIYIMRLEQYLTEEGKWLAQKYFPDFSIDGLQEKLRMAKLYAKKFPVHEKLWVNNFFNELLLNDVPAAIDKSGSEGFKEQLEAIIANTWSIHKSQEHIFGYGYALYRIISSLLKHPQLTPEVYNLSLTLDFKIYYYLFIATGSVADFERRISKTYQKHKKLRNVNNRATGKKNRTPTKHQKLAQFVLRKLHTGQYDHLEGAEYSEFCSAASTWIARHNRQCKEEKNGKRKIDKLSPTSEGRLKPVLVKYIDHDPEKILPNPKKLKLR